MATLTSILWLEILERHPLRNGEVVSTVNIPQIAILGLEGVDCTALGNNNDTLVAERRGELLAKRNALLALGGHIILTCCSKVGGISVAGNESRKEVREIIIRKTRDN